MPFAAVAGALFGSILAVFVLWIAMKFQGGWSEDGLYFRFVLPVISSGLFGYIYSYIVCEMAPHGKVIAGAVMATLLGVFGIGGSLISWTASTNSTGESVQMTVGCVAILVGAIIPIVDLNQKQITQLQNEIHAQRMDSDP